MVESWGTELTRDETANRAVLVYKQRDRHVAALLENAARWEGREHLIQGDRRVGFSEFLELVNGKAEQLASLGVGPGARVLLFAWNSVDWVCSFWAILAAGGTVVLGNPWWSSAEIQHAVSLTDPLLILTDAKTHSSVPLGIRTEATAAMTHRGTPLASEWPGAESDPALIIFTSGTTGLPKAVVLSHMALIAGMQGLLHGTGQLPVTPTFFKRDIGLWSMPLFHIGGIQALLKAVLTGSTIVFTKGRFEPAEVLRLIEDERVQRWTGVPTMYSRVMNDPAVETADLSSLKSLNVGGAPVSTELMQRINHFVPSMRARASTGYGLTEGGGALTVATGNIAAENPGTSGKPLPCVEIHINNPTVTGDGEILVRSPTLMDGYLGEAENDLIDEAGWLHTGDLGRLVDGLLYITGRHKDLIIRGGENIAPALVEAAIMSVPGVREVAVLGLPDHELGEVVAAVVVSDMDESSKDGIIQALLPVVSTFAVPTQWWFRENPLPISAVGKVDKKRLREDWFTIIKNSKERAE